MSTTDGRTQLITTTPGCNAMKYISGPTALHGCTDLTGKDAQQRTINSTTSRVDKTFPKAICWFVRHRFFFCARKRQKMKNRFYSLMTAVILGFVVLGCESKTSDNAGSSDANADKDEDFAIDAVSDGLFEVQVSKLAVQKANAPEVKAFARKMVDAHAKANEELKALAGDKGIALPDVISEKQQETYYELDKHAGAEFDREFIDLMVEEHRDAVNRFERQAENGEDVELKTWVQTKIPQLRRHLEEAQSIQETLRNAGSSSARR